MHAEKITPLAQKLAELPCVSKKIVDGAVLAHQGDEDTDYYLVTSGYLKFTHVDASGAASISALLNAGQVFGNGCGQPRFRQQTVTAKGQVQVNCYRATTFEKMLASNGQIGIEIIAMLNQRQALLERRLHAVLHLNVRARIALVLNDLSSHHGGRCGHGHEVDVPLTQQELAELVGASRPVVSSRLNDMRRDGVLDYSRDYICVDDRAALHSLSQTPLYAS